MPFARIYVKRQIQLDSLTFRQREMYDIGNAGLESVKNRVRSVLDANDRKSPPLLKRYARKKSWLKGGRAVRDLTLTGEMMNNLQVRRVSENQAIAENTSRTGRIKAAAHAKYFEKHTGASWLAYSRRNVSDVFIAARRLLQQKASRLLIEGPPKP